MALLVLLQGGEAIPHDLGADDVLIGRHPECGVQLESNAVSPVSYTHLTLPTNREV